MIGRLRQSVRGALLLAVVLLAQSAAAQDAGGSKKPSQPNSYKETLNACLKKAGVYTVTGGMDPEGLGAGTWGWG